LKEEKNEETRCPSVSHMNVWHIPIVLYTCRDRAMRNERASSWHQHGISYVTLGFSQVIFPKANKALDCPGFPNGKAKQKNFGFSKIFDGLSTACFNDLFTFM
jgi:hypothetical protein